MTAEDLLEQMGPGDISIRRVPAMPPGGVMPRPDKPSELLCGSHAFSLMSQAMLAVHGLLQRAFPGWPFPNS